MSYIELLRKRWGAGGAPIDSAPIIVNCADISYVQPARGEGEGATLVLHGNVVIHVHEAYAAVRNLILAAGGRVA